MLVAISIPIFTSQLEKSRQATDAANIRAAYAEATTKAIDTGEDATVETGATMKSASWDKLTEGDTIGGVAFSSITKTKGKTIKVTVDSDGTTAPSFAPGA